MYTDVSLCSHLPEAGSVQKKCTNVTPIPVKTNFYCESNQRWWDVKKNRHTKKRTRRPTFGPSGKYTRRTNTSCHVQSCRNGICWEEKKSLEDSSSSYRVSPRAAKKLVERCVKCLHTLLSPTSQYMRLITPSERDDHRLVSSQPTPHCHSRKCAATKCNVAITHMHPLSIG